MSDRKYSQSGYQDSGERKERPTLKPQGPRERDPSKGPRGRGMGAPSEEVAKCGACGARIPADLELSFGVVCPSCGKDLHTCSNCTALEPSMFRECRLGGATLPDGSTGQKIAKKSTRNECALFTIKTHVEFAREATRDPLREASGTPSTSSRSAFDALFKS